LVRFDNQKLIEDTRARGQLSRHPAL